jgi:excisionase family DNA binding protein
MKRTNGSSSTATVDVLTIDQVADELQVDRRTVRKAVIKGELRSTHVGRLLRFKRVWINEYLEREARGHK